MLGKLFNYHTLSTLIYIIYTSSSFRINLSKLLLWLFSICIIWVSWFFQISPIVSQLWLVMISVVWHNQTFNQICTQRAAKHFFRTLMYVTTWRDTFILIRSTRQ